MYLAGDKIPAQAASLTDTTKTLVAEVMGTFALAYVVLNVETAKDTAGKCFTD